MNTKNTKKLLAVAISVVLSAAPSEMAFGYQGDPNAEMGGATDSAPRSAIELQALVAPIALYPDPLVAQVLSAATFPDQVAIADYWVQQNKELSGQALTQAVNKQSWDASVKALTQFPTVLDNMSKNLNWTSSLGEAYHNQASDVMQAIQTLRAQARAAGHLKSGPQMTVVQQTPDTLVIEPTDPQVVYVPEYDPATIYGEPYVVPGYTAGEVATAGWLGFGTGVAIGALAGSACCGWGWGSWACDWHGGVVAYNHTAFYGNNAWHGGYYSGYEGRGAFGHFNAYNSAADLNRAANLNRNFDADRSLGVNSWWHDTGRFDRTNVFSGMSGHFGGFGDRGGWASRADSFRGWRSMRAGGFRGGRFGGGGFGGGHFGGFHGGFRR